MNQPQINFYGVNNEHELQFDFAPFYNLGKQAAQLIKEIEDNINDSTQILGLLGKLSDGKDKTFDDFDCLTESNELKKLKKKKQDFGQQDSELKDIKNINSQLIKLIKVLKKYKFKASLVEISLFDPYDITAKNFYTFIYASDKKLIQKYMKELQNNISKQENRGPILPNPNLYDVPLVQFEHPNSATAPTLDVSNKEKLYFFIANQTLYLNDSHDAQNTEQLPLITKNNLQEKDKLQENLTSFFIAVLEKVFSIRQVKDSHTNNLIDTAILIPLLRPTGKGQRNHETRLKGGGLFIYGALDEKSNEKVKSIEDLGLLLKHKLDRATMDMSNSIADLENARYQSKADILHYIPYAFTESVKQLIKYQKSNPDFQIPTTLYIVAVETALAARGSDNSDDLKRFIFGLPVEDTLKDKGLGTEVFEELSNDREISRQLAEYSLSTHSHPIFPKQLKKPKVMVSGDLTFEKLGLTEDIKIRVFIALLIIILTESIEQAERYLNEFPPHGEDDDKKIKVVIKENLITITYPISTNMSLGSSQQDGTRLEAINLFSQYLSAELEISYIDTEAANKQLGWGILIK